MDAGQGQQVKFKALNALARGMQRQEREASTSGSDMFQCNVSHVRCVSEPFSSASMTKDLRVLGWVRSGSVRGYTQGRRLLKERKEGQ